MRASAMTPLAWARLRTWLVWLALLVLATALYRFGSGSADATAVAQAREHKVSTTEVGRIDTVQVHEGQAVRRGDVLVRLDTREIDAQIALARAELERVEATVPATTTSLSTDSFDMRRTMQGEVERAEAETASLQAAALREKAELEALGTSIAQEQDLVTRGLVRADRLSELAARRTALEQAVRDAPSRLAAAARRTEAARARLAEWSRRFAAGAAEAGASAALTARLQPLQAEVASRRVALSQLEQKRRQADVVAPIDGLVQTIVARNGDTVRPGDPMLTLVEQETTQLIAYVAERNGARIEPGASVEVLRRVALTPNPRGDVVEGVVTGLAAAVTLMPTRFWPNPQVAAWGREVYIRVPVGSGLAPGEAVDVRFGPARGAEQVASAAGGR